jgi:phage-related baseplate assembly protein
MELVIPEFLDRNVNDITLDMISFYETATGKTLQPAQPERLLINTFAYREALLRNAINDAALQNLVDFSRFPILDYLGQIVGVNRLEAQKAVTNIEFNLLTGHTALTIQTGTRVSNATGTAIFSVIADAFVGLGINTIVVKCEAETAGILFNNYLAGSLNVLLDAFTGFDFCSNIDNTSGGSDSETDIQLRARIKLAPSSFSVAGPRDAYKFFAYSANPAIIDVSVTNPIPGQVNIYPLTSTVPTPQSILDEVFVICNGDKVRPLTDTVLVVAPTPINYSISLDLTLYVNSDDVAIIQQVTEALNVYSTDKAGKMGIDIIRNQIIALGIVDGVYNANLTSMVSDLVINDTSFGNCTSIIVNVVGYNNG